MDQLTQLAIKHGTDKWGKHHYTPVYYDLFKDKRESVKKVLEIGPAEGAGLFMFRDFFPNATIYGAEIDKNRVEKLKNLDRIKVFQCDQSNRNSLILLLNKIDSDIDLVIDDGSHKPEDQFFSADQIVPSLNEGAVYIIEDVADKGLFEKIKERFFYYDCKVVNLGNRYDDRLIIIKKI